MENVGGETINSTYTEKLLGLHINLDFECTAAIKSLPFFECDARNGWVARN